ncbi:MAG: (2Fe-2S)-binding protein [Anaerolineales bacterium]|nr:(2Fe-2S)-binding protein [Anaerolineales bacterium]
MNTVRLSHIQRGAPFEIKVDGKPITAYHGETIATALMAAGIIAFHKNRPGHAPSRLYCGMGVCMQCLVTVDGTHSCQACKTLAKPGMKVEIEP